MLNKQTVISFDGIKNCVDLGNKPQYKIQGQLTLETWVYVENIKSNWDAFFGNLYDDSGWAGYGLYLSSGTRGLTFRIVGTTIYEVINLNQWFHVAATYDGAVMKLYINGEEKQKGNYSGSIRYVEKSLELGAYHDTNEFYPFQGKMTETRLWNVARSQEEIKNNMNQRLTGQETGLVGYWPLDEGSGNIVHDKTESGNHGSIVGQSFWGESELGLSSAKTEEDASKKPEETGNLKVEITHIFYKGVVKKTQSDEYVEITNQESKPADISGWQIASGIGRNKFFTFPAGTTLAAGQKIRVYTNEVHPETGGFSCGSKLSLWKDSGDEAKLLDAKGNLVSGLAYDSKGNFTKITNEQTSEATFESVKAELGVPNLKHNINDADVKAQTTPQTKVSCVDAFRKALKSFIEDGTDDLSAFAEVREFPSMYDLPDGNNDAKLISEKVRETLNNHCHIKLLTLKSQDPEDNEYSFWKDQIEGYADRYNCSPNLNDSWIFVLDSNKFNNYNCAVVDKAGAKPTVNWGFLYG